MVCSACAHDHYQLKERAARGPPLLDVPQAQLFCGSSSPPCAPLATPVASLLAQGCPPLPLCSALPTSCLVHSAAHGVLSSETLYVGFLGPCLQPHRNRPQTLLHKSMNLDQSSTGITGLRAGREHRAAGKAETN